MALYTDKGKSGMRCVIQGKVCIFVAVALLVTLTAHLVLVTVYADYAIFGAKDQTAGDGKPEMAVYVNLPGVHRKDHDNFKGWKEQASGPFQVSSVLEKMENEDEPLFGQSQDLDPIENKDVARVTWETRGELERQSDHPKEWISDTGKHEPQHEKLSHYVPHEVPQHKQHDPQREKLSHYIPHRAPQYKHHGDELQPDQPNKQGTAYLNEIRDMLKNFTRELYQKILRKLHSAVPTRPDDKTQPTPSITTDEVLVLPDRHYSTHHFQGRHFDKNSQGVPQPQQQKYRVDMVRATVQDDQDLHNPDLSEMQGDSPALLSADDGTTHQVEPQNSDEKGQKQELETSRGSAKGGRHEHRAEASEQEATPHVDTVEDTATTQPSTEKQEKKDPHQIAGKPHKKPTKPRAGRKQKKNKKSKKQKPRRKTEKTPSKLLPKIEPSDEKEEKGAGGKDSTPVATMKPEEMPKTKKEKFHKQRKQQLAESGVGKSLEGQSDTGEGNDNRKVMTEKEKRRLIRKQKLEVKKQFGLLNGADQHGSVDATSGGNGAVADFAVTNTANKTLTSDAESKLEKATSSKRFKKLKGRIEARITKEEERRKRKERRERRGKVNKLKKGLLSVDEYNIERTKGSEEWEATDDITEAHLMKADSEVRGGSRGGSRQAHSKMSTSGLNR